MKGKISPEYLLEVRSLIGSWLKEVREDKQLSQEQLAEIMGMSRSTIAKIEAGKWSFSIDMLTRFCVALDVFLFIVPKDANDELATTMRKRWSKYRNDN